VLLRYLSEPVLRESITTITNRVGSFYNFSKWLSFGNAGVIGDNDPDHLEKIVKSTARSSYNAAELTVVLNQLAGEGHPVRGEDVAALSPNSTRHILRFGDYVLDLTPPSSTVSTHLETAQSNRRSCREFARQTMVQLGRKTSSVLWRVPPSPDPRRYPHGSQSSALLNQGGGPTSVVPTVAVYLTLRGVGSPKESLPQEMDFPSDIAVT
jgi:hypothetical protein